MCWGDIFCQQKSYAEKHILFYNISLLGGRGGYPPFLTVYCTWCACLVSAMRPTYTSFLYLIVTPFKAVTNALHPGMGGASLKVS